MNLTMRKLLFLLLFPILSFGQQRIVPGRVEPKIPIAEGSSENYALFLPQGFSKDSIYTTVFIFDPDGRGEDAVRAFAPAARLTNTILIAPNTKIADSLPTVLNNSELFMNTLIRKWPIDEQRLIVAGKDIGGLLATTSGHLSGSLLGVIAVDNAFVNIQYTRKNKKTKYKLLLSDESERYYTMQQLNFELRFEDAYLGLTLYDPTESNWPDAGYLTEAVTAILLTTQTNSAIIDTYYDEDIAWGTMLYNRSRFLTGYEFVNDLKKKYKGKVEDEEPQKELLKSIRNNGGYKAMRSKRLALREREALLLDDFVYYLAEDVRNSFFDNLGWWNSQMTELDAKIDSTAINPLEKKMAKRLQGYVRNSTESRWNAIKNDKKSSFEQKLFVNVLRTLIDPKNYDAYLQAISYSTREGDTNAALFYLEELLQNGFTDMDALYTINGTSAIRISKEYNAVVKQYLGSSKYY